MKTEYNIVWVDDHIDYIRGDERDIRRYLSSKEVELKVIHIEVISKNSIIDNQDFIDGINQGNIDFLLIDFNMPGLNGVTVIEYIRTVVKDYHTPIVFYSSDNTQNLPDLINVKNQDVNFDNTLDGVFFCHRDFIRDKVINLMDSLLLREHKVNAVRGMLMEKVSEIDVSVMKAIAETYTHVFEDSKDTVLALIRRKFNSRKKGSAKVVTDLNGEDYEHTISYILDNPRKTDNHFRAEILREILRHIDDFKTQGHVLSGFYNPKGGKPSLNCYRNMYAHQTEDELGENHSEENNLFIKAESRKHKDNIYEILSIKGID